MAEKKDNTPQFPERSGGSLLKTAIAASPLAVGTAAALRGISQSGSIKQPMEAGLDQAIRASQAVTRGDPYIPTIAEVQRFMQTQSPKIHRQAWEWAVGSTDPFTRNRMLSFTEGLDRMSDAEMRSAIVRTIASNDSSAMQTVWNRYRRNVSALARQAEFGAVPRFTTISDLAEFAGRTTMPITGSMPSAWEASAQRIATSLKGSFVPAGITRPEVAAEGYGIWNIKFRGTPVGEFKVTLPQIVGGTMLEGAELQTRRIAPDILALSAEGEVTRMGRSEFFLKELEEGIVPEIGGRLKTQRDVEEAVRQLKTKVFGELEAVPNVLTETRTAAAAQREALRAKSIDVMVEEAKRKGPWEYQPGYRRPTETEVAKLLASEEGRAMGLTGGVGPKGLAGGRLSTAEWERFYLGQVAYGRRPEQPFRQYQATEESMKRLGQYNNQQRYRAFQMVGDDIAYENVARPKLKATYIDPERYAGLMERAAMGEGEALIRAETGRALEFEESVTKRLTQVREDIARFKTIKPGEVLGTTATGAPVTLPKGARVTGVRRIGEETLVELMQRHQFRHGSKIFGGAKAVTLFRSNKEFGQFVSELGAAPESQLIANMDELRKNRALHRTQVIESLQNFVNSQFGATKRGVPRPSIADLIRRDIGPDITHQEFLRRAMRSSIQLGISPKQFGEAFGATGYVLESYQEAAKMIREAAGDTTEKQIRKYITAASRGISGGLADITFGGPRLETGGLGSLEPRAFNILKSGAMGKVGEDIGTELMGRLIATSPETLTAHREINKTLMSMAGMEVSGAKGARVFRPEQSLKQFIETGGGIIRPGQALPDIYVPGADVMQQLRPFETAEGVTVRGKISNIYEDIAQQVGLFQEKKLTRRELEAGLERSAGLLLKEAAVGGKGTGAVARGKILGSRFLRGVSAQTAGAETAIREASTIGITKGAFESMYNELWQSGAIAEADKLRLAQMRKEFMAGKDVGGMLARHPFIGEFSLMPTMIRRVEGESDLVVLPEIKKNIRIQAEGRVINKTLTLGPLVGLAGDKDADAYSVMLLGPRNEEKIRKAAMAQDSEYLRRYTSHQIRMQLFKGKSAAKQELTTLKNMMYEVEKLSVGQKWIAPLSLQMTEAKEALGRFGRGSAAADARFLLEWLEQTPISAKHLSAEKAAGGGLASLMQSITSSMSERNAARLRENVQEVVKDNVVSDSMLRGNVRLSRTDAASISRIMNVRMNNNLLGVDVEAGINELMRSLGESDASGFTRQAQLMSGRGARVKMNEIAEVAAKSAFNTAGEAKGMFAKVTEAIGTASNRLGALGRGIVKHHKAIGFGFAGSVALASVLSSPAESVGPGRAKIPDARLNMNKRKAANRMRPEDTQHPASQPVGQPTAPRMVRNQNVRLAMNTPRGVSGRVTARIPPGTNPEALAGTVAGIRGNTSVHLRDTRTKVTDFDIANKLL